MNGSGYYIDSHCHLDSTLFSRWREIIREAEEKDVKKILSVFCEPKNLDHIFEMMDEPNIYFIVGCHPHQAVEYSGIIEQKIIDLARKYPDKVVAIGETGLDYYYNHSPPEIQKKVFRRHLVLAEELNLPVVIHTREAGEDTLKMLHEAGAFEKLSLLFHCYSQSEDFLSCLLPYPKVHFSFSGMITFKKAHSLRRQLQAISLANLMVETDAPYMAPEPFRGKENNPSYIPVIVRSMADTLGMSENILKDILNANTLRFFRIKDENISQETAYEYKGNIYLNITSYCGLQCPFCIKKQGCFGGNPLILKKIPDAAEVIQRLQEYSLSDYKEIVFCGYGEPTLNLPVLIDVSNWIRNNTSLKIRVNTNGLGNYYQQTNIVPLLAQHVDYISISMNASSSREYRAVMNLTSFQPDYYTHIKTFLEESRKCFSKDRICISAVRVPELDPAAFEEFASQQGVHWRLRP